MRRLPIYFLIDVSESMVGEPIQQVEEGLATIMRILRTDPYALETVWVSVLVFAGQPKTLEPLQELTSFYPPKLPIGSGTSLGKGLGHLMFELRKNTVATTAERKGDWKPIIFLFTDGVPTDDSSAAIREWKQNWKRAANMVAISFGDETNTGVLKELTDDVLHFHNADAGAYKQFFKWVTDSIKTSSVSVENNSSGFELADLDTIVLSKIDTKEPLQQDLKGIDTNYVVLLGKCQNTQRLYLMKYRRQVKTGSLGGISLDTLSYKLVGAFQVGNSYFELSDNAHAVARINTDELIGAPTCPCCGNQTAFAICSCGKLHCIGDEDVSTCPWCGNQAVYGSGEGGIDVNRTQG